MEERRLLLAVALSFIVLLGYRALYAPPPAPPPQRAAADQAAAGATAGPTTSQIPRTDQEAPRLPQVAPSSPEELPEAAVELPAVSDSFERRVEVNGRSLELAFTNKGARLLSWRLRQYTDKRGAPEEMVRTTGEGRALDIVTGDLELDARLKDVLFLPTTTKLTLSGDKESALDFEYVAGDLRVLKAFRFHGEGYVVSVAVSVQRAGREIPKTIFWGPGVGNPTEGEKEVFGYLDPQAVLMTAGGLERLDADAIEEARPRRSVRWAGVAAMYFTALWIPPEGIAEAEIMTVSVPSREGEDEPQRLPVVGLALGLSTEPVQLYVGPKDYHILDRLGRGVAEVVPVGDWIGPVVVPLLGLLRWVYGYVGSYGWSIVALTILINLAMAPLRHYSIANGIKMAKLAPEMKVIQDRYRKVPALDPRRQEMQKEVAALYARHGMSMGTQMAVGCVPLLLTMPFLIAFYRVLMVSIDLRGESFLWLPDLSQKDPLYLTPVLMGVSMLVMQRMTPTTMDPAQKRIMLIMPLVLVVMFFAAPAGLNLYWLASNLCSIIQQGVTIRIVHSKQPPAQAKKERKRR